MVKRKIWWLGLGVVLLTGVLLLIVARAVYLVETPHSTFPSLIDYTIVVKLTAHCHRGSSGPPHWQR